MDRSCHSSKAQTLDAILQSITADAQYLDLISQGEPTRAHPEGAIGAHIRQLEDNLRHIKDFLLAVPHTGILDAERESRLKILIHVHDTFKPISRRGVGIHNAQSHATLGAQFLSKFTNDKDLIESVQLHDLPYSLYRNKLANGSYDQQRLTRLLAAIEDWDTFMLFQIIDNTLPAKSTESTAWFIREVRGMKNHNFAFSEIHTYIASQIEQK